MSVTHVTAAALTVITRALWVRRLTWRQRWEAAGTINLACIAAAVIVMLPFSTPLFDDIGRIIGIWNLEDLAAHLIYLFGIANLTRTTMDRPTMPEGSVVWPRFTQGLCVTLPTVVACFLASSPHHHVADLLSDPAEGWRIAYWCALAAAQWWILGHLLWALLILRDDPDSRVVATIYCAAVIVDMSAMVARCLAIPLGAPLPGKVAWWLIDVSSVLYAVAAIDGTRRIQQWWFTPPPTSAPPMVPH